MNHQSICELSDALSSKKISAVELCQHYLKRIKQLDKTYNAVTHIAETTSMESAKRVDEARAKGQALHQLAGVPLLVKENFCTKDMPTTWQFPVRT